MENIIKPKKNRPILKFIGKLFNSVIVRGSIKSLPFGNLVYEAAETARYYIDKKRGNIPADTQPPHDIVSQLLQLAGIIGIFYAFINKWITIEDLIKMTGLEPYTGMPSDTTIVNP